MICPELRTSAIPCSNPQTLMRSMNSVFGSVLLQWRKATLANSGGPFQPVVGQAWGGPKTLGQITPVRPFVVDIVTQAVRLRLVPTVLSLLGNRVVIYPNDHRPAHVHVIGGGNEAVFDLRCPSGPPELRENYGFSRRALRQLEAELTDEIALLCGEWSRIHG